MIIGLDDGPFPNMFVPNTSTMISVEGEQDDAATSNSCMHVPFMHDEAGTVYKPQIDPLVAAVNALVYDIVEPLMVSVIVVLLKF